MSNFTPREPRAKAKLHQAKLLGHLPKLCGVVFGSWDGQCVSRWIDEA